jgi:hypothetical protein
MAKIYQLMVDDKQINNLYYTEDDAIENATQIARDSLDLETMQVVEVWEAEEIEDIPVDCLEWTLRTIRF